MLGRFGPYFTDAYRTPWGDAVNVAEPGSDGVRRYFIENAVELDPRPPSRRTAPRRRARHRRSDAEPVRRGTHERRARRGTGGVANGARHRREQRQRPAGRAVDRGSRLGMRRGVERRRPSRPPCGAHRRSARVLRRLPRCRGPRRGMGTTLGLLWSVLPILRPAPRGAGGRRRPSAVRRVRHEPRPCRQHARGATACSPMPTPRIPATDSPRRRSCCRLSRRCCSWVRSTARPRRSRTSSITATRR